MDKLLEQEIENSVKALKEGKTILYPTDTIWGIGCDATNAKAVEKIYKIKKRDKNKSMIILLDSPEKLEEYAEVPDYVYDLIESTAKPLTIIYQNAKNLAKNLVAKDKTIAIRIAKGEYCTEMIRRFGKPVVSTSANLAGEPSPLSFRDISQEIINKVDYTVQIFHDRVRSVKPSKIIKLESDGLFTIIRE